MGTFGQTPDPEGPERGERPRIGLVLSGGGARGGAHVGVIRVLEEYRIPVDLIVGTSFGSIVGGIYASGVSPEELEAAFREMDWVDMGTDRPPRKNIPFRRKEEDREGFFQFEMGLGRGGLLLPSGLIAGQKLNFFLRSQTLHATAVTDFDNLSVPFRAVATDLDSGEIVILGKGDLAKSIRASMAVPGAFTPVRIDGRTLIDGGIVRNLPVDIARSLGADIIIAVDVSSPPAEVEGERTMVGVASQAFSLLIEQNVQEQLALLGEKDILIRPDLTGIKAADFTKVAAAIVRGEEAARRTESQLRSLSVPEGKFADFLEKHLQGSQSISEEIRIDRIEVSGLSRVSPKLVSRRIRTKEGEVLDLNTLRMDLERIFQIGAFQQVDFALQQKGDGTNLVFEVEEKSWGPGYLRLGLTLESNFEGRGNFRVLGNYTRTMLNPLGAEWKSVLLTGDVDVVFTEFYQPLDYSGFFFVAPQIEHIRDQEPFFDAMGFPGIGDFETLLGRLDVGFQFKNYGEIRFGVLRGTADLDLSSSSGPQSVDVDIGGWVSRFTYDTLDNTYFPHSGAFGQADLFLSREKVGADDEYDKLLVTVLKPARLGRNTLLPILEYGSGLGSDLPFYDQFFLGGFLDLSGLEPDERQGEIFGLASLVFYRQIGTLPQPFGRGIYLGGSLEAGNIWQDSSEAGLDDLRYAGSIFGGLDTILGPVYIGFGHTEGGQDSFFFFLGQLF